MKLNGDDEYVKRDFPVVQTVLGAAGLVLLIILVVWVTNTDKRTPGRAGQTQDMAGAEAETEEQDLAPDAPQTKKRRAQDLNFWGMYPEDEEEKQKKKDEVKQEVRKEENYTKPQPAKEESEEEDPATDGKHVQVIMDDGSVEWLAVNRSLPMNSYEDTAFQKEGGILKYYRDGRNASYTGVILDRYSGSVDFNDLKKSGVSFVMIRVGGRGYDSGVITEDDQFETYMQAATEAGINIGVYFSSQALTPAEAAEEADFMIQKVAPYKISYPMAVRMETIRNDTSRTSSLSKNDRTTVMRIFMEAVAGSAYKPLLMGDKNFLITKVDLAALSGFGILLHKSGDIPEYPYQFSMWQYTDNGTVSGAQNDVGMLLSFIDYSVR